MSQSLVETITDPTVFAAIIAVSGVLITAAVTGAVGYLAYSLNRRISFEITQRRIDAYASLWERMEVATPVRTKMVDQPLQCHEMVALFNVMTSWYYEQGNGMLLTNSTRNMYLAVKHNLICCSRYIEPEELRCVYDDNLVKRGRLSIRQLSLLRTRMKADLQVFGTPFYGKLDLYDAKFLSGCKESLYKRPWGTWTNYWKWMRMRYPKPEKEQVCSNLTLSLPFSWLETRTNSADGCSASTCPGDKRESGKVFIDEQKRLFKRIIQSEQDLDHAADCAEQILQRNLHSVTAREDKRLLRCLNTALIVSYVRPFSSNRGGPDVRKALPAEYLEALSDEQRQLHDQLVALRNRDHAHSDPLGRSASVGVERLGDGVSAITLGRDAFAPLTRQQTERVAELIQRWRLKLSEEHLRIQGALKVGERF